jgi:hypothetical protein
MLTAQINTIVESSLDESSFATTWQKEYENEHENCLVMHNNSNEENEELRMWIDQVQIDAQCSADHHYLEPYKIIALNQLGFNFVPCEQPCENYWLEMFQQLKDYLTQNGGKMSPRFIAGTKCALGQWCDTQLDNYCKFHSGRSGVHNTGED